MRAAVKPMRSTKKPTKQEQSRLDAIHAMPCICCELENEWAAQRGDPPVAQQQRTEAHHLVDMGNREASGGHMSTIPLCIYHHRGDPPYNSSAKEMRRHYGPSLARNKGDFTATYGSQRVLLEIIDARLSVRAVA